MIKTDIDTLKDTFEAWYAVTQDSRNEMSTVINMYHNRQWDAQQLRDLASRGQPKETFNIIKLMARTLVGYYSAVVNKAVVEPRSYDNITKATMINDALKVVYERADFDLEDDDTKLYGMLSGLFATYTTVTASGKQDIFGRNEYDIGIESINPEELITDPASNNRDFSDSRGVFRFKWMSRDSIREEFRKSEKAIAKLDAYDNHVDIEQAEYTYKYASEFVGKYKVANMYLVVQAIMKCKGGYESVFWCDNMILGRHKIDHEGSANPYTLVRLNKSNKAEVYGLFREVIEPQKAINQALIQIQLMVNSNKVLVENNAVEDVDEFADTIARVNAVAEVNDLQGIRIENLAQNVLDQYTIIDKAYMRIKEVLGVNDAMLGQAYAADSGRKVKLQKNTGVMTLRHLTGPLELFHKRQAQLLVRLMMQYFTAHQILRVTDDVTGNRFIELNKPLILPKLPPQLAQLVMQGLPINYALQAMVTGQLNPAVMQAMEADQMAAQAQAQYQQQQGMAMQEHNSMVKEVVAGGKSPQNIEPPMLPPPPPPPNNMATMPDIDISSDVGNMDVVKLNKTVSVKPEGGLPEELTYVYDEMLDPMTGKPMRDRDGAILMTPVSDVDSQLILNLNDYDILIVPSSYDDEDEKAQLMMEILLNGPMGQFAMNASPGKYAKMVSLSVQSMKTKHSPEIAQMFNEMAMELGQNPEFEAYMRMVSSGVTPQGGQPGDDGNGGMLPPGQQGGGPQSSAMKLPQNTNEGY